MLKHYAGGFALTAFAIFARPYGGFGSFLNAAYALIFVAGIMPEAGRGEEVGVPLPQRQSDQSR